MDVTSEEGEPMYVNEAVESNTGLDELTHDEDDNYERSVDGDVDAGANVHVDGEEHENGDDDLDEILEGQGTGHCLEDGITINSWDDIFQIDFENMTYDDVGRFDFGDLELAYLFYTWYSRVNGFSVRKGQVVRNNMGEMVQQTFVCSRQGYREERGLTAETRRRAPRHETRCGCEAKFRVHVHLQSGRWYVKLFNFDHNHELLEEKFCALLPAHRKMKTADVMQIKNFRGSGIRPPHMLRSFANAAGGYDKVGFIRKDIYNQGGKERREQVSDANGALKFLRGLRSKDPLMFVRHTVDDERRLQHLFWCDGESRMNYQVFGDVLAFDATYNKNKYSCPLVIFSGVNHHNQTVVFATALVSNETEDTYVWLLEQFMIAMNGNAPSSVITDGDIAMRNAIKRVFPHAHHRLCAWHLLHNAISRVGNPDVMPYLKRCMLGDLEVRQFEEIWLEMVAKFGLEDNVWVLELYDRRRMWSTAHIRGNFFAGIRTTSRCEALHSHIRLFVHSKITLTEFVQQFQRCLSYFRFREVEADFRSNYGQAVLQTTLHDLERSAARHFTKEVFYLFRPVIKKASLIRVVECHEMAMYSIYMVSKYRGNGTIWHVTYCPSLVQFRCSCLRMESIGLPCDHIVGVMVYLDFTELPSCLVLDRWTKTAKESIRGTYSDGSLYWDSQLMARYTTLVHLSRDVAERAYHDIEDYNHYLDILTGEYRRLQLKHSSINIDGDNTETQTIDEAVEDPLHVRSKGCGSARNIATGRQRRAQTCGTCGERGHNRRSCPNGRQDDDVDPGLSPNSYGTEANGDHQYSDDFNNQLFRERPETFIASTSGAGPRQS